MSIWTIPNGSNLADLHKLSKIEIWFSWAYYKPVKSGLLKPSEIFWIPPAFPSKINHLISPTCALVPLDISEQSSGTTKSKRRRLNYDTTCWLKQRWQKMIISAVWLFLRYHAPACLLSTDQIKVYLSAFICRFFHKKKK